MIRHTVVIQMWSGKDYSLKENEEDLTARLKHAIEQGSAEAGAEVCSKVKVFQISTPTEKKTRKRKE